MPPPLSPEIRATIDRIYIKNGQGAPPSEMMEVCSELLWENVALDRNDPDSFLGGALCLCASYACRTGEVQVEGKAYYERAGGLCVAEDTSTCNFVFMGAPPRKSNAPTVVPIVAGSVLVALVGFTLMTRRRRRQAQLEREQAAPAAVYRAPAEVAPERDKDDDRLDRELKNLK